MPAPSARTNPSARASKVRTRPVGETILALLKLTNAAGSNNRFTPPTTARLHSPDRNAWQARSVATSEDEQAVSTEMLGPLKFILWEMRFEATLIATPVAIWDRSTSG